MVVIGILATALTYRVADQLWRTRDAVRFKDSQEIFNGLNIYYTDHQQYPKPKTLTRFISDIHYDVRFQFATSASLDRLSDLKPNYLSQVPVDPVNKVDKSLFEKSNVYEELYL